MYVDYFDISSEMALPGSSRSPNTIAPPKQFCTHAGALPESMYPGRVAHKSHLSAFLVSALIVDGAIRTGSDALLQTSAQRCINYDNSIGSLNERLIRTRWHTSRILALHASEDVFVPHNIRDTFLARGPLARFYSTRDRWRCLFAR